MTERAQPSTPSRPSEAPPTKRSVSFRSSPATATIPSFSPTSTSGAGGTYSTDTAASSSSSSSSSSSAPLSSTSSTTIPSSSTMSATDAASTSRANGAASTKSPPTLKGVLKPSSRKLPPPDQYQHPDPLIRRLRLVDSQGKPINLRTYFRDCKVVALYFSSQWAGVPLREYQKTITDFQLRYRHEFKVIYISVDVDEEWYKAGIKEKPWVSMVWNDGSSLPSDRFAASQTRGFGSNLEGKQGGAKRAAAGTGSKSTSSTSTSENSEEDLPEPPKLYNGEDFLLASEIDIDAQLSMIDTDGNSYLRPYSRVHLAAKLDIIAAPTLAIYHIPSHRLIERNVRMRRMQDNECEATWARWSVGEGAGGLGFRDALHQNRMMVIICIVSIAYMAMIQIMGPEWNFLARLLGGQPIKAA